MSDLYYAFNEFVASNIKIIDIVAGFVVLVLLALFRKKIAGVLLDFISKIAIRKDVTKREPLKASLQKPLEAFFLLLGIFICVYLNFTFPSVIKSFKIAVILVICWGLVNYLSGNLFLILHFGEDADNKINTTAIKFISNILKIIIIAFAVVMVISELGYNINGLITGIGVGGLAVSLAAQDAVSNLISGFIIVLEKPFKVGDFVQTKEIMGTVDEVSMRSTKIRTLEDTLVTIPNSTLTSDAIINISRIDKRLISIEFGLTYSTSNALLKECQEKIKEYLNNNEDILSYPLRVEFDKLDDSSLNLAVFCYTSKTDINAFYAVLSDVNYAIKKIIEDCGAEFAFPSKSIYIEKK